MTRLLATSLSLSLLSACVLVHHPEVPAPVGGPGPSVDLSAPGPIVLESVVSARWAVPLSGLVNLENPKAVAAGLQDAETPIVLPVHVLTHPEQGVFVVDTGAPADPGSLGALVSAFAKDMVVVDPIEDIAARHGGIRGALITHAHIDHVMGLAALPEDTKVYMGPGELEARAAINGLTRGFYRRALRGKPSVTTWAWEQGTELGGLPALDVFDDGSLFALHVPGHTDGSTAYLARTTEGPVLFTGDCAHLRWSWENVVESGSYSADQALHAESLGKLKALALEIDGLKVYVGHELDGVGTGVGAL
ncbi:MAG: MBL fold metallo-hydrolase [Alphaproteobacteria bacterium]|nr:MBL fold metallo-hydrolase [Alphaproteobacteria bacterium]